MPAKTENRSEPTNKVDCHGEVFFTFKATPETYEDKVDEIYDKLFAPFADDDDFCASGGTHQAIDGQCDNLYCVDSGNAEKANETIATLVALLRETRADNEYLEYSKGCGCRQCNLSERVDAAISQHEEKRGEGG